MKIIEESARKRFNEIVLGATRKAQEKYGFNMTDKDGNYSTWNNEADAFKHAYLSWLLSWYQGDKKSKELGDMHEDETPNAPAYERNMDLWNNAIGREIAYEMKWRMGDDYALLDDESASEFASQKIWEKMQQGELITNPFTDKKKFEIWNLKDLKKVTKFFLTANLKILMKKQKQSKWILIWII